MRLLSANVSTHYEVMRIILVLNEKTTNLLFLDTIVESSRQDDEFLTEKTHLLLELNLNGKVWSEVRLISRKTIPSAWDADQIPVLKEEVGELVLSIVEVSMKKRRLHGFAKLSGPELYDALGEELESKHCWIPKIYKELHKSFNGSKRSKELRR
ncbi:hypothetical protein CPB86DRAFT_843901 [Serendipita vermifera]|nr:hypothetical protein CPB86DRAFT_843901 [Serendipita vermifera]